MFPGNNYDAPNFSAFCNPRLSHSLSSCDTNSFPSSTSRIHTNNNNNNNNSTSAFENQPPKAPRKRRAKAAQIVDAQPDDDRLNNKNSVVAKKKPGRKPGAKRQMEMAQRCEMVNMEERQRLDVDQLTTEQRTINRAEQRVVDYSENGQKLRETTITTHNEDVKKEASLKAQWASERQTRIATIDSIFSMSMDECKKKSGAFCYLQNKIQRELHLFHQKAKLYLGGDLDRAWTHFDFVARFLFGITNTWDKDAQLEPGDVPWLACLWTMSEMLDFCNDAAFLSLLCSNPFHASIYSNEIVRYPDSLFCVDSQMMCGFVTGQLLAHAIPDLKKIMRECVQQEVTSEHFPCYEEYLFDRFETPTLLLKYDFRLVNHAQGGVPSQTMRRCKVTGTCSVFGIEEVTENHIHHTYYCDGPFLQLLQHQNIKNATVKSIRSGACDVAPQPQTLSIEQQIDMLD